MISSKAPALMFQGTGSGVGKSLLVAGLCRAFTNRGYAVCPFKPQNMSNNAAVTLDGGEIGRAQAMQAEACNIPPDTKMNPVLLKPQSDMGAQVLVAGKVVGTCKAEDYHLMKPELLPSVLDCFNALRHTFDLVFVEGAGSPAEINLRPPDIANMGFASAVDIPVVLVGDIDRGGVLASLIGTYEILPPEQQRRILGYIVNKFRGDMSLFTPAIDIIRERTGLPCFGVVPFFEESYLLPEEDSLSLDDRDTYKRGRRKGKDQGVICISVPKLPRMANFDDLTPLRHEPDVQINIIVPGSPIPGDSHIIMLPGSKSTLSDLEFLFEQGWDIDIKAHIRQGGSVIGFCGGYQMMGQWVKDPFGIEGKAGVVSGLGLFDMETTIEGEKIVRRVVGQEIHSSLAVEAYEIHTGKTIGAGLDRSWFTLTREMTDTGKGEKEKKENFPRHEGIISADRRIMGSYLHGLFVNDAFRTAFLAPFRQQESQQPTQTQISYKEQINRILDNLARHLDQHLDLDALFRAAS